jgi:ribosomal protein L40E
MPLIILGVVLVLNASKPLPLVALYAIAVTVAVLFGFNVFYCHYFHQSGRWLRKEVKPQETYFDKLHRTNKLWVAMRSIPEPQVSLAEPPDRETKFCRKCGAKIPRDSIFCEECGAKLVERSQEQVTVNECYYCGQPIDRPRVFEGKALCKECYNEER